MNARKILLWDVSRSQPLYYLVPATVAVIFFAAYFFEKPQSEIVVRGVGQDAYIVSFDHEPSASAEHDQRLISAAEDLKDRRGLDTAIPVYAHGRVVAVMVTRNQDSPGK